jgi:hypothetical protein
MSHKKTYKLSKHIKIVFSTPDEFSHWFGYYNICPIDNDGIRLLAHRVSFDGRNILPTDFAEVGWFDLHSGEWHKVGKTRAFNWQQGAMLQWLGPGYRENIIFNDEENNSYISRIVDTEGTKLKTNLWPIYGVIPDGSKSLTLQYERSYWCRAYHYEPIRNEKWNVRVSPDDGIFSLNLKTNKIDRIIDIQTIVDYDKESGFESEKHWLEHIMINPSGNRFVFYHRFTEGFGFKTRVFTADMNGDNLYLVPDWRQSSYSHLEWKNDEEFVLFGSKRLAGGLAFDAVTKNNIFMKFTKDIYRRFVASLIPNDIRNKIASSTHYKLFKDGAGQIDVYSTGMLKNDGHPSFSNGGMYMLTDTYADVDGYRHLLILNTINKKLLELGKFFSPFNEVGYRSDLHPRFSLDMKLVIIDSAHSGKHQITVLALDWQSITEELK